MFHLTLLIEDCLIVATPNVAGSNMLLVTVTDTLSGSVRRDTWTHRELWAIVLLAAGFGEDGLYMIPRETFQQLYTMAGPLVKDWGKDSPIP